MQYSQTMQVKIHSEVKEKLTNTPGVIGILAKMENLLENKKCDLDPEHDLAKPLGDLCVPVHQNLTNSLGLIRENMKNDHISIKSSFFRKQFLLLWAVQRI